jgi:hypothetical protein
MTKVKSSSGPDWLPVEAAPMNVIEAQYLQEQIVALTNLADAYEGNVELLKEELNDVIGRMTDATEAGWVEMTTGTSQQGAQLQVIKNISSRLRDMTSTNPLLQRGHQLRRDYVYARGVDIDPKPESSKRNVERKMNDSYNYEMFFSEEGHDTLMRARYTDGNRFTLVNKKTGDTVHLPLSQVENAVVETNDPSRIKYIARALGGKTTWYATDLYDKKAKGTLEINGTTKPVNREWVVIHKAYNRPAGATWGLPDALPAYLWVLAYSAYLKDNAALVKAFSRIAIRISAPTKTGAENAKRVKAGELPAGSTAVTGSGYQIDAMSNTGSGVNFNNGRPLAAMVATSLGVSIVALLSDPGTGGSYGVAETLDPPTLLLAATLQSSEADYYKRLLSLYGANRIDTEIKFPTIDKDPAYRVIQALLQAVAQGLFSREEARPLLAMLFDLSGISPDDLPEKDGFNKWTDPDAPPAGAFGQASDPSPKQGNKGAAGAATQGDTNNDERDGKAT